jgi:hypothetical protein
MRKTLLVLLILMAVLASGCRANSTASVADTPQATAPLASATSEVVQTATTQATLEPAGEPAPPPGCTVVSPRPTPGPTEVSIFPPADKSEWQQGPEGASVTFVEYSDFQ